MNKLKPCICGDSKIYIKWKETTYMASPKDWTEANNCQMFCDNCGRRTKTFITPEEAWNAWNNREVEIMAIDKDIAKRKLEALEVVE